MDAFWSSPRPSVALIAQNNIMTWLASNREKSCSLATTPFKEPIFAAIAVSKGFVYKDIMNFHIQRIKETGLLDRLRYKNATFDQDDCLKERKKN